MNGGDTMAVKSDIDRALKFKADEIVKNTQKMKEYLDSDILGKIKYVDTDSDREVLVKALKALGRYHEKRGDALEKFSNNASYLKLYGLSLGVITTTLFMQLKMVGAGKIDVNSFPKIELYKPSELSQIKMEFKGKRGRYIYGAEKAYQTISSKGGFNVKEKGDDNVLIGIVTYDNIQGEDPYQSMVIFTTGSNIGNKKYANGEAYLFGNGMLGSLVPVNNFLAYATLVEKRVLEKPLDDITMLPKLIKANMKESDLYFASSVWDMEEVANKLKEYTYIRELYKRQYAYDKLIKKMDGKAKTWMTKKNINKETQDTMENNSLLKNFSFVEIDNEMKLDDFRKIENEFNQLSVVFKPFGVKPVLRFRKLGHLRASGVYFPVFTTIAVDIRSVGSFAHEYGHYMDYCKDSSGEQLSLSDKFSEIATRYTELYRSKPSPYDNQSKYNDSYFLTPTEIFARAFEIYLKMNGMESSFLQGNYNSYEYKMFKDEELQKLVKDYFDNELGR